MQEQQEEQRTNLQTVVDGCKLEFGSNQTRLLNFEGQLAPLLGAVGGAGGAGHGGGGRVGMDLRGWKDAEKPKEMWEGEETTARDWFDRVKDFCDERIDGLGDILKEFGVL